MGCLLFTVRFETVLLNGKFSAHVLCLLMAYHIT